MHNNQEDNSHFIKKGKIIRDNSKCNQDSNNIKAGRIKNNNKKNNNCTKDNRNRVKDNNKKNNNCIKDNNNIKDSNPMREEMRYDNIKDNNSKISYIKNKKMNNMLNKNNVKINKNKIKDNNKNIKDKISNKINTQVIIHKVGFKANNMDRILLHNNKQIGLIILVMLKIYLHLMA